MEHKSYIQTVKQLDAAVYRHIICNPCNGLTDEQFKEVLEAHVKALKAIREHDSNAFAAS